MGTFGSPIRSVCHRARPEHTFDTTASAVHDLCIDLVGTGALPYPACKVLQSTNIYHDYSVFTTIMVDLFGFVWPFSSALWSQKPPLRQASSTPYGYVHFHPNSLFKKPHTYLIEHAHGILGQPAYREGKESAKRGVQFFGILSSVMISLALL